MHEQDQVWKMLFLQIEWHVTQYFILHFFVLGQQSASYFLFHPATMYLRALLSFLTE